MREITTQEATAVVGGMEQVRITGKRLPPAPMKNERLESGGGVARDTGGGGGGGGRANATVTCVDTIVQVRQAATGIKSVEFGVEGVKFERIPKIEHVTITSVCTTVKANASR